MRHFCFSKLLTITADETTIRVGYIHKDVLYKLRDYMSYMVTQLYHLNYAYFFTIPKCVFNKIKVNQINKIKPTTLWK